MNFLERANALCSEKGITKNKLLISLKLSKNSFVDWSKRGTVPNGETLGKIATYFGVSTDYLLGLTDSRNELLPRLDLEALEVSEDYLPSEGEVPKSVKPPVFVSKVNFLLECEGITRSKFVSDLGFSREIFSQWTKGSVVPSSDDIVRVAKYLDISIDYLMNDEFLLPIQPLNLTDDEYGLLCHYRERDSAEQYSGSLERYFPNTKKAVPESEQLSDETLALLEIVKTMTKEEIEQIIAQISSLKSKRNP